MTGRAIRALSFVLGLALVTVGLAASAFFALRLEQNRAQAAELRALTGAVEGLEGLSAALDEAVAANAPLPALVNLRHEADLASAALDRLARSGEGTMSLRRFAVCCGEIAAEMIADLAADRTRVPDYALLAHLRDFAEPLTERVLPAAVDPVRITLDDDALVKHFAGLGRLYYDGIGSDILRPAGYSTLVGGEVIEESDAKRRAAAIVGGTVHLRRAEATGEPARYCFTGTNLTVTLTADGRLLSLLYDRRAEEGRADESAILAAAEAAVARYAPEPMTLVETDRGETGVYFTYAPTRDGILCLSERVLVGIECATARLSLFDADRYFRYHTPHRTLRADLLDPTEVALSRGETEPAILCTVLRTDGRELLCYRVGESFVNAVTGRVESVMDERK